MEKDIDFDKLSETGLSPIYARAEGLKHLLAYKFCMTLLASVDNWERHYEKAKSWFDGPLWAREKLSDLDKKVYFWRKIAINIKKRPYVFFEEFPEEYHCYTEENYTKLCEWVKRKDERIIVVKDDVGNGYYDDTESSIMNALSHGYGDEIGYD